MNNISLILRIVAVVAAIAATTLFFISQGKLADKNDRLLHTKGVLAATQDELSETQSTLERTESELATERDEHARTRNTLSDTRAELADTQADLQRTTGLLGDAREEITELNGTVAELRSDLSSTRDQLASAQADLDEALQMETRIAELEESKQEMALTIESQRVVLEAAAAQREAATGRGVKAIDTSVSALLPGQRISRLKLETTVNSIRAADGLIVLNATPDLEFAEGQTLTLVQDMQSVGRVRVESVEDNDNAVAHILPDSRGTDRLRPGSTVQMLFLN